MITEVDSTGHGIYIGFSLTIPDTGILVKPGTGSFRADLEFNRPIVDHIRGLQRVVKADNETYTYALSTLNPMLLLRTGKALTDGPQLAQINFRVRNYDGSEEFISTDISIAFIAQILTNRIELCRDFLRSRGDTEGIDHSKSFKQCQTD